jgi:hypothetical protein
LKYIRAEARAWYSGKIPPDPDVLAQAEEADPEPLVLFQLGAEARPSSELGDRLYDLMDTLKRSPNDFRTWTDEDGYVTFIKVLLDLAPKEMRTRVLILRRLGDFRFRKADGPKEWKDKISAVFTAPDGVDDVGAIIESQARRLSAIWSPKAESMLQHIISQPAQVGRVLADRLNPASAKPLRLVGHPFTEVHSTLLRPIAESKVVAYEREGEIHLVTAVRNVLEQWDQDSGAVDGCEQLDLLDALLLHEVVEVVLDETEEGLEPLDAHIVAAVFERYLKGELLQVAVEDFFLDWPPRSTAEVASQRESELAQQLVEMDAFLGENEQPDEDEDEDDVDDLPFDTAAPAPKRKTAKKKVAVRAKDGKKTVKKRVPPKSRKTKE